MRIATRHVALLMAAAWAGGFAWQALKRWSYASWCARTCGPFTWVELLDQHRRASDWQTPALLAALPLLMLSAYAVFRFIRRRRAA